VVGNGIDSGAVKMTGAVATVLLVLCLFSELVFLVRPLEVWVKSPPQFNRWGYAVYFLSSAAAAAAFTMAMLSTR